MVRKSMHTRSIGPELWMCERGAALCGSVSLFMQHSHVLQYVSTSTVASCEARKTCLRQGHMSCQNLDVRYHHAMISGQYHGTVWGARAVGAVLVHLFNSPV